MIHRLCSTAVVDLRSSFWAAQAGAQQADPPDEDDTVDLFGFGLPQTERLKISGELIAGWSHDGMQAQLGFEKQARVGQATITFSGRVNDRVRYLVSFNPVNEVAAKPACGEPFFFFPNDPTNYPAGGPLVPCDPEKGNKRVDTYNTYALDYINQQGPLREGYVDWRVEPQCVGQVRPVHRADRLCPSRARIVDGEGHDADPAAQRGSQLRLDAGVRGRRGCAGGCIGAAAPPRFEAAVMGMVGDGDRQKDYNYFYFADASLDTNSALNAIASVRVRPHERIDVRAAYKYGYSGSKVERLPNYFASKRHDDALVAGVNVRVLSWVSAFGEYARYVWGPTGTSAQLVGVDTESIEKPGYYAGARVEVPVSSKLRVGTTVTLEEISRDDSLVKYLAANNLFDVELGKKDRGTVVRVYVDVARLVTVGLFWNDVSNPYPWVSGAWPVAGPRAFTGRAPDKYGLTVMVAA